MEPGDCLLFHSRVLHCAPANASTVHRRRALSTRWCGEQSRYAAPSGCVGIGYPNFEVPLVDGGSMVCPAFPVVWPRSHPLRPPYDPDKKTIAGGGGGSGGGDGGGEGEGGDGAGGATSNELLPESVAAAYEHVRQTQAAKYSLEGAEAEVGSDGGGGGKMEMH